MRRVHEMTDTLPSGPGFPRLSAVCMRSLTAHPAHKGDPHDTLAAGHVRAALAVVAAGADVIQRDEPEQNMLATYWGGCLCRHCIPGFYSWVERHADPQKLAAAGVTDLASFDYAAHLRAKNAPSGDGFRRWAQRRPTADIFPAVPARGVGGVPSTVAG